MSLSRRVAWLLAALLLVVMSAGMAIHTLAMRQALQAELQLRNHEGAQLLAATLAPLAGELADERQVNRPRRRVRCCSTLDNGRHWLT